MVLMLFVSDVSCCACVVVFDTFVYMFMVCCSLLNIVLLSLFWRLPSGEVAKIGNI
jgi:hypothetical protein